MQNLGRENNKEENCPIKISIKLLILKDDIQESWMPSHV